MGPAEMLAGPRGRRLCGQVAGAVRPEAQSVLLRAFLRPPDDAFVNLLTAQLHRVDPAAVAALPEPVLLGCLADTVAFAAYWQEPDEQDRLLADPRVVPALLPVARALLAAPGAGWWHDGANLDRQRYVQWLDASPGEPPTLTGAADWVVTWRDRTVDQEARAACLPADPAASYSGSWWSAPVLARLVRTSRPRPGLGAVQLLLTEDALGWRRARVRPLTPRPGARVYEITGPEAWAALVQRYSLRVTRSRLHDWWRVTGRAEEWFIPDWSAVAAEYDGVHLTVLGYLTTAGRAVDVPGGATVLAGWDPDATYWLRDVLAPAGDPTDWELCESAESGDEEWHPVAVPA
ncbi:hypothetical protein [Frankia sp. QA3]|uniref:hypothetical protein n=1 Tax=Frankia sp. QA3 TaxID=710111 RepID=UPI000269C55E|nr:hypothetical protein [Frankia sp. QA3]EIV93505.1 hypothetical protein FraQA3DRAFT_3204 [Frankia sp. QA3]